VFVHLYLNLVRAGYSVEAQSFFSLYWNKQETFYEEELLRLKSITSSLHLNNNEIVELFTSGKFTIRMSSDSYQCLKKYLQVKNETLLLKIIQSFINLELFDGTPRTRLDIRASMGALDGEAPTKANKSKVFWGIPRDPDLVAALQELEEEESEMVGDDEKPKKKKPKKDPYGSAGKKGKSANVPNAPPLNRIPLPKPRDCEQLAKFTAFKESAKCVPLGPDHLPSVCCYTLLNTYQDLTGVSISDDSSLLAAAFSSSRIKVWSLSPRKLYSLKPPSQMQQVTLTAEDVMERIVDMSAGSDVRVLVGHAGPVYCTTFNADNSFLASGSEDGTVRLWSLQSYTCLLCFKGHNYPVWSVNFSPQGFYFVSGSHDRTARVWSTDHIQPLRILAGHLSDIDVVKFHPNGNYVATGSSDKAVRLWDILTGHCVRIFTGHKAATFTLAFSSDGKLLASAGADKRILVWDIGKASKVCELKGHTDTVYQLVFSRDGTILASGGLDNCVKLWDVSSFEETDNRNEPQGSLLVSLPTKSTPIHSLHFTRKNLLLVAGPYTT
jgi:transcription initiation factor TFIID subunit 5